MGLFKRSIGIAATLLRKQSATSHDPAKLLPRNWWLGFRRTVKARKKPVSELRR